MKPKSPVTTAVMVEEEGQASLPTGPRGLIRLFPWSDDTAPGVIPVAEPVVLGRDAACTVVLGDDSISRSHATIAPRGQFVQVSDLGSSNGTFVAERRIDAPALASPGDLVRFGRCLFLVVLDANRYRDWWSAGREGPLVGGPAMVCVRTLIRQFGPTGNAVLVAGETGTGKEIVASELHRASGRPGPFVPVNCAAVPEQLFEDLFFGHRKGAFTGADRDESGFFRAANHGTIFLDEVGELGPAAQAKLLRTVETRQVVPLGSTRPEPVDVRIVSATNRDLSAAVAAGSFRADLHARLHVLSVDLPPLRERPEDVALLTQAFLAGGAGALTTFDVVAVLVGHSWPANVRELRNVLTEAETRAKAEGVSTIALRHLRADVAARDPTSATSSEEAVSDDRRAMAILDALTAHKGNVSHAAEALGLHRAQVYAVLRRLGQKAEDFRGE